MMFEKESIRDSIIFEKLMGSEFPKFCSKQDESTSDQSTVRDYLVAFSDKQESYCISMVDMVHSTKISASLSSRSLSQYYEVFLNSMAKIISAFGGKVIKNIGDCLLYYFPKSTVTSYASFKDCLDCGLAMIKAQPSICHQLNSRKLPCLNIRVSADYGSVLLMNTTESASLDMIGPPVNMCSKINRHAEINEFVIGGDLYELVKKMPDYNFKQKTSCDIGIKYSYPVYKITI